VIVVDASALVAIGLTESDMRAYQRALAQSDASYLCAINYVETMMVLQRYGIVSSVEELDAWLDRQGVELMEGQDLGEAAADAYLRYGRGCHPARLNLGDCFAYALAKTLDAPLLYKGDDFAKTDIRSALQPT
jgi:ribonuclease VapC